MRLVLFSNSEHVEMFAMNSNIGNESWMKQNRHEINIQPILNVGRNFQPYLDFEIKLKKALSLKKRFERLIIIVLFVWRWVWWNRWFSRRSWRSSGRTGRSTRSSANPKTTCVAIAAWSTSTRSSTNSSWEIRKAERGIFTSEPM